MHTCSLGAVLSPGADDVVALLGGCGRRRRSATTSTPGPAVTGTGPDVVERVERVVAVADLVKASDEDLEALYPRRTPSSAAARLLGARARRPWW